MPMYQVVGEEDRYLQPAAQRGILQGAIVLPGDRIEGAADIPCGQFLGMPLPGHVRADADQAQLADLFLQRHLPQQLLDERRLIVQPAFGQNRTSCEDGEQAE